MMGERKKIIEKRKDESEILARKISNNPEGKIFIAGFFLLAIYCLWLFGIYFISPEEGQLKATFSITRLFIGNPAGILLGYTMGFSQNYILFANLYIETVNIFIIYPLLTFLLQDNFVIPFMEPVKLKFLKIAKNHEYKIKKYGIPGLFIFSLFPIWGKGPIVASLIGFLMKLKPRVNMYVVLSGTYLAIITQFIVFKNAYQFVLSFNPRAPIFLFSFLIVMILGINIYQWFKNRKGI